MNGKKARAIRKEHNVKHVRLATIRVVREQPAREGLLTRFLGKPKLAWGRSEQLDREPRYNSHTRRKLRSQRGQA